MTRNKKMTFVILSAFIAIFAVVALINSNNRPREKEVRYLSASWEYNYRDIEEITKDSDLIALVTVQGVEDTLVESNTPYTIFAVEVSTPIYNSVEGECFFIYMTGSETKDRIVELIDDSLLQKGDEILVFCKKNPDGTYQIMSGPQGRLVYEDGKLSSLNTTNSRVKEVNTFSNINIQNADADLLIEEIKGYLE